MAKDFWITDQPINLNDCIAKVVRTEAGAINTFIGTVREFTKGKRTLFLEYQAYIAMAEKKLCQIGNEISEKWPDAKTAIVHRIGRLELSDIAVVIAVSTPHRNDAFAASRYAIERIKEIVPIWKKEHWEDGTEWIGDQKEMVSYMDNLPTEEEMKND
ncbi:molybdenum cofactor biosynthesis protein MoaE [Virgibacillus dakarensis]|uniref:Molybdopterin synthase catalytic subunit n=1 Tax=Lentibacillus populi TaxID=1827502 RepID=A0A9W5TX75_9BACI|nr:MULTISPECIES: molybdenum cofactor biosynthesis protein MoaE [Bacillaceae]MBT2215391.1 molybdenum cofactor biosynthesis protein MoaE [Virgibacillus dakarensis]MTW85440.1 molybdenum cofactor biosynthesis protein MoaE [Virgibacillus dakarensis]GGB39826.1 molybdopterin (MPT) converting factor, subunit 2 [Lentibacillus populi]